MNPYELKQIKNKLDFRLVELLTLQNEKNEWLSVADCAAWVFETNNPSEYHRKYTQNKLISLVGDVGTSASKEAIFEAKYAPGVIGRMVFRIKSGASTRKLNKPTSMKDQINQIMGSNISTSK